MQNDGENKEDEGPSLGTVHQVMGAEFIFMGFLVFFGIGPSPSHPTDGMRVAEGSSLHI